MSKRVEEALKAARETEDLIIGKNVLTQVPELFQKYFKDKKAIIVADTTTYRVAGQEVFNHLQKAGIEQDEPFIFDDPNLYAEYSFVEQLSNHLKNTEAIALAVGSGTINDLTKLASHENNRQYMCIATAASMDGYTAFGASVTFEGAKQTFNCPAPKVCVADIDILKDAPVEMTASGYSDLFAKVTAGADWILADELNVEKIDPQAWSIVQDGLHDALSAPQQLKNRDEEATRKLIEGLMLGGFAMQWSKSSRPASGAEHQFSHLWNMEHHTNNGENVSHGFQVAIGTLAITALYEHVLAHPFDQLDIDKCVEAWPSMEQLEAQATEFFKDTDFPTIGVQETAAKYVDKDQLREQLSILKNNWPKIKSRLEQQLISFKELQERLKLVGAPYEPEHIGVSREYLKNTFVRAQFIRRRFTVLDLIVRTNTVDYFLNKIFGKNQIWDLKPQLIS